MRLVLGQKAFPPFCRRLATVDGAAIIGVTLAACAATGAISKDSPDDAKQAAVTKRANARWQAIVSGDVDASYAMLSAGSKATTSPEVYHEARLKGFTEGTVQSATCTSEVCKVVVKLGLDTSKMKGLQVSETETWILEKGKYGTFSVLGRSALQIPHTGNAAAAGIVCTMRIGCNNIISLLVLK